MALVDMPVGGPLISRLEAWGYQEKSAAPLASIVGNLDLPSRTLLERLADDLMHMNENAHNSRAEVTALQGKMKLQQLKLEQAVTENQSLSETIVQLTKELNALKRISRGVNSKGCNIEEQVKQWRAQSMHQLEELERVNQSLRSTLKLHCNARPSLQCIAPNFKSKLENCNKDTSDVAELQGHKVEEESQVLKEKRPNSDCTVQTSQKNVADVTPTHQNEKLLEFPEQPSSTDVQMCLEKPEKKLPHVGVCTRIRTPTMTPGLHHKTADLPALLQMLESIKETKSQSVTKVEGFKEKMDELQATLSSQETTIASLRSEISNKNDQLNFITDEKAVGEEALQASQLVSNKLAALVKWEAGARKNAEAEIQRRYMNLRSELEGAQAQVSNLWSELEQTKRQHEGDQSKAGRLESELHKCMNLMENAEQDVEQLKNLIIQLCATREDLVSRLKVATLNEKRAEKRVFVLDVEVQQKAEETGTHVAEASHLRGLLQDLSQERAHLQSETNIQAERISLLTEDNMKLDAEVRFLRTDLQATLQRLQAVNSLLSQAEAECVALKEKISFEEGTNIRLEELWTTKCLEHNLTAKELGSILCDHQILKQDLIQLTSTHEDLIDNHRKITIRLKQTEQALSTKGIAQEEVLAMNQEVWRENQQLKRFSFELENQVRYLRYNLQGMEGMFDTAMEQARSLGEEIQHRASELKVLERKQSGLLNDYQNEKATLMSQLSISKLEVETLTSSWKAEQQRVRELEHLLACLRVQQRQLEIAGKRVEICPMAPVI